MDTTPPTRNGVETATFFATLGAVEQAPAAAQCQFRAHDQWVEETAPSFDDLRRLRQSRRA